MCVVVPRNERDMHNTQGKCIVGVPQNAWEMCFPYPH